MMRIWSKNNLCIDDGGGTTNGATRVHMWTCGRNNNNNQWGVRSVPGGFMIVAARKNNLCLDSSGLWQGAQFQLWTCNQWNPNQIFQILPRGEGPPPMPQATCELTSGVLLLGRLFGCWAWPAHAVRRVCRWQGGGLGRPRAPC